MRGIDPNEVRDSLLKINEDFSPYASSVPTVLKDALIGIIKEFTERHENVEMLSLPHRKSLFLMLPFCDESLREQVFSILYRIYGSPIDALRILYSDAAAEMAIILPNNTEQARLKNVILSIACLDKESKKRNFMLLLNAISSDQGEYLEALTSIYSLDVASRKMDFKDE